MVIFICKGVNSWISSFFLAAVIKITPRAWLTGKAVFKFLKKNKLSTAITVGWWNFIILLSSLYIWLRRTAALCMGLVLITLYSTHSKPTQFLDFLKRLAAPLPFIFLITP